MLLDGYGRWRFWVTLLHVSLAQSTKGRDYTNLGTRSFPDTFDTCPPTVQTPSNLLNLQDFGRFHFVTPRFASSLPECQSACAQAPSFICNLNGAFAFADGDRKQCESFCRSEVLQWRCVRILDCVPPFLLVRR